MQCSLPGIANLTCLLFPAILMFRSGSNPRIPMNPLHWLKRIFVPDQDTVEANQLQDESPFAFGPHLRIVLAIIISIISAGVIWWILV